MLDLTAHRTLALRDALGARPTVALSAGCNSSALFAFYPPDERPSCLKIKACPPASTAMHRASATPAPDAVSPSATDLLDLLAHSASLTINAVRSRQNLYNIDEFLRGNRYV